jgi:hypothetical protein
VANQERRIQWLLNPPMPTCLLRGLQIRSNHASYVLAISLEAAPESTPCPTLTTLPVFLKHSRLVLDTYEAAVRVCRRLSAQGV